DEISLVLLVAAAPLRSASGILKLRQLVAPLQQQVSRTPSIRLRDTETEVFIARRLKQKIAAPLRSASDRRGMYGGAVRPLKRGRLRLRDTGCRKPAPTYDDRQAVGWPVKAARQPEPEMSVPRTVAEIL